MRSLSLDRRKLLPKRKIKTLKGCKASLQSTTGELSSSSKSSLERKIWSSSHLRTARMGRMISLIEISETSRLSLNSKIYND